ncbi:PREDICTED: membrane-anchored ubiquitin-fold protein 2 [Camelina sativa]|uniref:Membrane-anchored ubiquitin-fold protein n=1 Tax=Camelina sativa TaxID=90675 RepID=A0ABM0T356_CAMSA|nr:PREDICTED: membrane-anchored ubiquitin-fold protein 2 [Camelina sativa]
MAEVKDQLEIKFRLNDGSDIGPKWFPDATTVATLKETVVAQWPKDKENGPKTVKDVKLISAGRILENNKTVGDCRSPVCNLPGAVTTMHVIIQHQVIEQEKKKKKPKGDVKKHNKCVCLCFGARC